MYMDPLGSSPEMDISISNCGGKIFVISVRYLFMHTKTTVSLLQYHCCESFWRALVFSFLRPRQSLLSAPLCPTSITLCSSILKCMLLTCNHPSRQFVSACNNKLLSLFTTLPILVSLVSCTRFYFIICTADKNWNVPLPVSPLLSQWPFFIFPHKHWSWGSVIGAWYLLCLS